MVDSLSRSSAAGVVSRYERRQANGWLEEPDEMHRAMRQARLTAAATSNEVRRWGAYQHYDNLYKHQYH